MNVEDKIEKFLKTLPFFVSFSDKDMSAIINAGSIRQYEKNTVLFLQGDKADRFYIVISGWVKLYTQLQDGEESILSLLSRGSIFGESAMLSDGFYHTSAQAVEDAKIFSISVDVIRGLIKNNPDIAMNMLSVMATHINNMESQIEHLTTMSAPQRVGCFLLELCAPQVKGRTTIQLPYDKFLIAAKLGMQPETFSRSLKSLREVGVNIKGNSVEIEKIEDLQKYSCVKCSGNSQCFFTGKCSCENGCSGKSCK